MRIMYSLSGSDGPTTTRLYVSPRPISQKTIQEFVDRYPNFTSFHIQAYGSEKVQIDEA